MIEKNSSYQAEFKEISAGIPVLIGSAGLTIVANVSIATGPALFEALGSSVINLNYYLYSI